MPSASWRLMSWRWLAMNQFGAVGGGERVVRAAPDGLVQAQVAEREGAVALARAGPRLSDARLRRAARDHDDERDERPHHQHAGRPGADERPAARVLRFGPRLPWAGEQEEQLGHAEEHEERAHHHGPDLQPERGVEDREDARRERSDSAQRAGPARARALSEPPQALGGGLDVLRVECRRRGGHRHAQQREQQGPGEEVAEEGVEQPGDRRAHLLVGHLVLSVDARKRARLEHQQTDEQDRPRRADRHPGAEHGYAAIGRQGHGAGQQQDGEQREDDAQHTHLIRDSQRGAGELAVAQRQQVRLEVIWQLPREVRRDRPQPELDDLGSVAEIEEHVLALADEEDPVGLERGGAEDALERLRLDQGADDRLEQRPRGGEVGRAALGQVDDDLAPDDRAHAVVLEGLHGAVREGLAVDDLLARVEGDRAGDQQDRADDEHHDAGRAPGAGESRTHSASRVLRGAL